MHLVIQAFHFKCTYCIQCFHDVELLQRKCNKGSRAPSNVIDEEQITELIMELNFRSVFEFFILRIIYVARNIKLVPVLKSGLRGKDIIGKID